MNDLLPGAVDAWQRFEAVLRQVTAAYGYREIRTPVLERTALFQRSIGSDTDIVSKEMYTFSDLNGESLTLRPEATASCVRAGLEHGLFHNQQQRFWYAGPMFRHEKPQKGRYRQFHQFGIEAFGWPGPDIDAEIIAVGERLWRTLGIDPVVLEINSLGSGESRRRFRDELVAYLSAREGALDAESRRRLQTNPLRILDSKHPETQAVIAAAPSLIDYLDADCRRHFDGLCARLDDLKVNYRINPRLVRGLDYYSRTVFEWATDRLGAQNAICAGGRYDGLVETLGGKPVPAAGFALGIERVLELLALSNPLAPSIVPDLFIAAFGERADRTALVVAERLRSAGMTVVSHCGGGGAKRQLRQADRSGAQYALVLGDDELARGEISVKPLRSDASQFVVSLSKIENELENLLRSAPAQPETGAHDRS